MTTAGNEDLANPGNQRLVLAAGVVLTTMLGSIHAFSVFLDTFENQLDVSRARASLIYSGALVFLTIAVLFGHQIYSRWRAATIALAASASAAIGVAVAGASTNYWLTVFGYSIIFGAANGVGYGFALQSSAQAMPERQGFAMGTVTAFYAFGATIAPFLFDAGLGRVGLQRTLAATAIVFAALGTVAALLLATSHFTFDQPVPEPATSNPSADAANESIVTGTVTMLLWLGYGAAAMSGLMVIGHATGIIESAGGATTLAVVATAAMATGNMLGGLLAGTLADRMAIRWLLLGLPLVSGIVMAGAAFVADPQVLAVGLVAIGFTYGAIIAVYPVVVLMVAGPVRSSLVYGRVFTSWGLAGLAGPWLAGALFDSTGEYRFSFLVAAGASIISIAAVLALGAISRPWPQ